MDLRFFKLVSKRAIITYNKQRVFNESEKMKNEGMSNHISCCFVILKAH